MASSKQYLELVLKKMSKLNDVKYKPMMGEYILYYREKIIGGIYDDRFLVKPTESAIAFEYSRGLETPYEGAGQMIRIDDTATEKSIDILVKAIFKELPAKK